MKLNCGSVSADDLIGVQLQNDLCGVYHQGFEGEINESIESGD